MIRLDVDGLSEEELKKIVIQRCSEFGSVSNMVIVKHDRRYRLPPAPSTALVHVC